MLTLYERLDYVLQSNGIDDDFEDINCGFLYESLLSDLENAVKGWLKDHAEKES